MCVCVCVCVCCVLVCLCVNCVCLCAVFKYCIVVLLLHCPLYHHHPAMVMLMFEDPVMTVPEGKGYVETCLLKTVNGSVANSTHPITVMIMPQERDTDAGSGLGVY